MSPGLSSRQGIEAVRSIPGIQRTTASGPIRNVDASGESGERADPSDNVHNPTGPGVLMLLGPVQRPTAHWLVLTKTKIFWSK